MRIGRALLMVLLLLALCGRAGWAQSPSPSPSTSTAAPAESPSALPAESPVDAPSSAPGSGPSPAPSSSPDLRPLQARRGTPAPPGAGAVMIDGHVAFYLRSPVGDLTPERRAAIINARLAELASDPKAMPSGFAVSVDPNTGLPYVHHKQYPRILFTVYPQDSQGVAPLSEASTLADDLAATLRDVRLERANAAEEAEAERLRQARAEGTRRAILLSVLFLLLVGVSGWLHERLKHRVERSEHLHDIRAGRATVFSSEHVKHAVRTVLSWTRVAVALGLGLVYIQMVLASFPSTRAQGELILQAILTAIDGLGNGLIASIPGLVVSLFVALTAHFMLRFFDFVIRRVREGSLDLEPYLPRELAGFAQSVGRFSIVLIALFLIAPNIPGAGTDMAKVITVVVGAIISFSSTTTIGNVLAGLALAYMRPFKLGDRVKMGEAVGDVVGSTLLFTRLRTITNEEILVPSMQVLNGPVVNYSAVAEGLIVRTAVSIGYDARREVVERLLLLAAERVEACEKTPPPFVLVTALDDFYVKYEMYVHTRQPSRQHITLSEINKAIKDVFDANGVEIMSPHYLAIRRGTPSTIPVDEG